MSAHALLSASSSHRWLNCPASVKASLPYENKSSSASEYGTAAHALSEMYLKGLITDLESKLGKKIEGVVVDREMVEGVGQYIDYVMEYVPNAHFIEVESRLDFSHIVPDGFGTADLILVSDNTLHVIDLKFGHGIVEAKDNPQLSLYAIGAINAYSFLYEFDEVVMHIAQPRASNFSKWSTTVSELEKWGEWVSERAKLALSDDAPFTPTSKGCQWCLHKNNCIALREHVNNVITGDFENLEALDGNADKATDEHVKKILDNMDLIDGFLKAIKDVALERMQNGLKIDGYKIVESSKHKAWVDSTTAYKTLKGLRNEDDFAPRKLVTPTQALKLLGKSDADKLVNLWYVPKGEPVLVTESDKRPAIGSVCDDFQEL